jgi:hypothetical protein
MPLLKLISSFFLYFTSLFAPARLSTPVDGVAATPFPALPTATPTYQTKTYTSSKLGFTLNYPANLEVTEYDGGDIAIDTILFSLQSDVITVINPEDLLHKDLMCTADGPNGYWACKNTAVRPFTTTKKAIGYLVKRQKDISGTVYDDHAYVFPAPKGKIGLILSVEEPTAVRLEALDVIAQSFAWKTE